MAVILGFPGPADPSSDSAFHVSLRLIWRPPSGELALLLSLGRPLSPTSVGYLCHYGPYGTGSGGRYEFVNGAPERTESLETLGFVKAGLRAPGLPPSKNHRPIRAVASRRGSPLEGCYVSGGP